VEKLYQRKCYSIEFKRDVQEYWSKASVELTIRKFWPDEKNLERQRKIIYKWKKNKSDLVQPHLNSAHLALTLIKNPNFSLFDACKIIVICYSSQHVRGAKFEKNLD
jgi:hypothetical protein